MIVRKDGEIMVKGRQINSRGRGEVRVGESRGLGARQILGEWRNSCLRRLDSFPPTPQTTHSKTSLKRQESNFQIYQLAKLMNSESVLQAITMYDPVGQY